MTTLLLDHLATAEPVLLHGLSGFRPACTCAWSLTPIGQWQGLSVAEARTRAMLAAQAHIERTCGR